MINIPPLVLDIAFVMMGLAFVLSAWRIFRGPTIADRVVGADLLGSIAMAMVLIYSIKVNTFDYLPVVLVIAIIGFASTLEDGKFLAGGDLIDRSDN